MCEKDTHKIQIPIDFLRKLFATPIKRRTFHGSKDRTRKSMPAILYDAFTALRFGISRFRVDNESIVTAVDISQFAQRSRWTHVLFIVRPRSREPRRAYAAVFLAVANGREMQKCSLTYSRRRRLPRQWSTFGARRDESCDSFDDLPRLLYSDFPSPRNTYWTELRRIFFIELKQTRLSYANNARKLMSGAGRVGNARFHPIVSANQRARQGDARGCEIAALMRYANGT